MEKDTSQVSESLDGFCDTPFWDLNLTWYGSWPQFTDCFRKTVLVWVPCGWLWLSAPFYTWYITGLPTTVSGRTFSWLVLLRLILLLLLVVLSVVDFINVAGHTYHDVHSLLKADVFAPLVMILTLLLAIAFTVAERRKRFVTSGVLFIFWLLITISCVITFYTYLELEVYHSDVFTFSTFSFQFLFCLLEFLLQFKAETPILSHSTPKKPSPEIGASFPSRLTFWWLNNLMSQGYKQPLTEENMPDLHPRDKSETVVPRFLHRWTAAVSSWKRNAVDRPMPQRRADTPAEDNERIPLLHNHRQKSQDQEQQALEKKPVGPSLNWVLVRTFWKELLLSQIWKLFADILTFCCPLILGSSLTMNNLARKESTIGEVVNLMSVDAERVENVMSYLWAVWSSPLQIILSLYLLHSYIGVSMFAGAAFLILLIPANGYITVKLGNLQTKLMEHKDQRMKVMNELLSGIKIIKLFAWERRFEKRILGIRDKELQMLRWGAILTSLLTFSWTAAPFVVSLMSFLCYVYITDSHYLDPKTAFVAISLFDILRYAINFAPMIVTDLLKAFISTRRIGRFLCHDDLDEDSVTHIQDSDNVICVTTGTFSWSSQGSPTLRNINISVEEGSLVAIVGTVGSGKSSLLSAILGDMKKMEGTVSVRGTVAYVPQQAWIQNDSVRNNILFGQPMNTELYNKCLDACALRPDLVMLPAGDRTEIGERGINLSGGQKQRVSLARAVYAQADIYLLDDPLSAVDSHVGQHIFDHVIGHAGLLQGKARVLVTHGIQYLAFTDHIIVMSEGQVSEAGHYERLLSHKGDFARLISTFLTQENDNDNAQNEELQELKQQVLRTLSETEDEGESSELPVSPKDILKHLSFTVSQIIEHSEISKEEGKGKTLVHQSSEQSGLIEEETVGVGNVKFGVFKEYIKSVGYVYVLLIVLLYAFYTGSSMSALIFLSTWTDDPDLANFTKWPPDSSARRHQNDYYIAIYGMFGFLQTVFVIGFSMVESLRAVAASRLLHGSMLARMLHAPMSFFDTTPMGRIINRFSKDLDDVDNEIPMTFIMWMDCVFFVASTIIVISYSTPIFLAFLLPIGVLYYFVQRFYIATSRQLKRLGSKTRSPIFNHFSETLTGASVIRAFDAQSRFVRDSEARVDANQIFMFTNYTCNRWLGFRLESVGNLILLLAATIAVATKDSISGGIIGLSITYALQITESLNWLVRMTSDLETQIVSVERIIEYTEVAMEADWDNLEYRSPPGWPSRGHLQVDNLSLRYREGLDLVLKGISFEIRAGEKVGIVGRTGAGKSSLTLALFRLVEPTSGRILIDDVDICRLGLQDLRSKITILPQDPVIFAGSLRDNLDPFSEHPDSAIWQAVDHAHLRRFVENLPDKLDHECGEGGENLSVGQRQLLCLGRALLRKTKVLVLDEATAAVDMETDELIQETIREEFKDCTILTIAHRLNTVLDYDRILVLDKGEIQEFDPPQVLLKNPTSMFFSMAKAAGLV
ncbi:unnamed protein product [Candidula unifasciata]|uniref:ABC-type glutathione-S-conjugate transporter n=1 Tax=Candidula unifasciata TaxID=100452 RepID=A0A8S3YV19_9EUPU|nr:unnamed protein product [Candidula unifasciata]